MTTHVKFPFKLLFLYQSN